jgi:hypothetical protein
MLFIKLRRSWQLNPEGRSTNEMPQAQRSSSEATYRYGRLIWAFRNCRSRPNDLCRRLFQRVAGTRVASCIANMGAYLGVDVC